MHHPVHFTPRCGALLCALLATPLFAQTAAPAASRPVAQSASQGNTIAAGPLEAVLNQFGQQAGILLSFPTALTQGKHSPGLNGKYDRSDEDGPDGIAAALSQLLAGTGLQAVRQGDRAYTLITLPQAAGATALAPVTVTAAADRSGTTEGTGRYTTAATAAATGLALSPRETPQSISVLTRQQMDDQNMHGIADALKHVTGISRATAPNDNRANYYARGFQITRFQYDGITTAANSTTGNLGDNMATDLAFYDRVEVVRGSTGLLTGSGEPSASVNLVRKRAHSREFTGTASLGLGTWDDLRGMVDLSAPLVEDGRIRGRVVAMAQDRDSFVDLAGGDAKALFAVVEADLTANTTLSAGADHQQATQQSPSWGGLPLLFSDGTQTRWSRAQTNATPWAYRDTTNRSVFIDLEHRFANDWKIKASAVKRTTDSTAKLINWYGDLDRATGAGLSGWPYYSIGASEQTATSLQATGPFDLLGRQHEAVLGWTGSRYQSDITEGLQGSVPAIDDFYTYDGRIAEPDWGTLKNWGTDRTRESGLYGALRLSLTDSVKLIVGGRQSRWKTTPHGGSRRSFDEWTPYAGLVFDLDDRHSLYASHTDVFQPQNYRNVQGTYLDPETGDTQEIGIKGEYFDGRLDASLALFTSQKDNVAVRDGLNVVPGSGGAWAYVGEKGVKSDGFEAQLAGELVPGWNLSAGFARTLTRKRDGSVVDTARPANLFQLHTTWRLPGQWRQWTVGGGLNWQSRIHALVNTAAGRIEAGQKAYVITDLMLRYAFTPQWSAQLNVNNAFDKTYWASIDGSGYFGAPRNAVLTMHYRF